MTRPFRKEARARACLSVSHRANMGRSALNKGVPGPRVGMRRNSRFTIRRMRHNRHCCHQGILAIDSGATAARLAFVAERRCVVEVEAVRASHNRGWAIGVAPSRGPQGRSPRGLHQAVINVALNSGQLRRQE